MIPHLKPVGHQSTNWMVRLVLMVATAALTSLGTTSPRYMRQHAMYLPWRGVALGHHGGGLELGVGDLSDGELLVVGLLRGDDGGVRGEHEVDARVRHQVGLELGDVDVEGTVEAEGRGERRDDLGDEAVEVGVGRALDVEGAAADVVDGLVVEHDGDVGVLEEGVGGEHGVVWLDDGGGDLWGRVDGEAELGLRP